MKIDSPFCFHIIYTPGTVKSLSFLVHSLLKWSDCTFRLVANGCTAAEKQHLQKLCRQNQRLSFLDLPTRYMMEHGPALNYLHALASDEPYFCFMDSDIYATGEFMSEFMALLIEHTGVFSGYPLWIAPDRLSVSQRDWGIHGHHHQTPTGICIGTTYFAIYNNPYLCETMQAAAIDFQHYFWQDLPEFRQRQLIESGLQYARYDTAKMLNLSLVERGHALAYHDAGGLHHIGGLSRTQFPIWLGRMYMFFYMRHFRSMLAQFPYRLRLQRSPAQRDARPRPRIIKYNPPGTVTREYFTQLLEAFQKNRPKPCLPTFSQPAIAASTQTMTNQLYEIYEEARQGGFI